MLKKALVGALGIASLAATAPASATTTFFTDFDDYVVDVGGPGANGGGGYDILASIEGWTAASGDGIEVQNGVAGAAFSPINLVELDSNNNSSMVRTIDAGEYDLHFYYSPRSGVPNTSNGINVFLDGVEIFAITDNGTNDGTTNWSQQYVQFTVGAAAPGVLRFEATGTSESLGGYVDSISLQNAVPEPATWAMMIGGSGLVGGAMRRRRNNATIVTA